MRMQVSAKLKLRAHLAPEVPPGRRPDPRHAGRRALQMLDFQPKKGAQLVRKVLESAIANAEHNEGADIDELKVATICVDEGPVCKRFQARAKGRGNRI